MQAEGYAHFLAWLQENHHPASGGTVGASHRQTASETSALQSDYLASVTPDFLGSLETLGLKDADFIAKPLFAHASTDLVPVLAPVGHHDISSRPGVAEVTSGHPRGETSGLLLGAASLGFLGLGSRVLRLRRKLIR
jgi:hypothetical protein